MESCGIFVRCGVVDTSTQHKPLRMLVYPISHRNTRRIIQLGSIIGVRRCSAPNNLVIGVVSAQHKHYRRKQYCSRRSEESIRYQTLVLATNVLFVVIVTVFAAFDGAPPSRIVDIPFDGFLEGLIKGMVTLPA